MNTMNEGWSDQVTSFFLLPVNPLHIKSVLAMNKTQFFRHVSVSEYLYAYLWDCWLKYSVIKSEGKVSHVPEILGFEIYDDKILIKFDGGTEEIPLEEFYDRDAEPFYIWWSVIYFDGPISGICERDGEKFWFTVDAMEYNEPYLRQYAVYKLTDEDVRKEQYWQTLWLIHIKCSNDLNPWYTNFSKNIPVRDYDSTRIQYGVFDQSHFIPNSGRKPK